MSLLDILRVAREVRDAEEAVRDGIPALTGAADQMERIMDIVTSPVEVPRGELPPTRPPGEGLPPGVFGRDGRPTVEPRTPLNVFVDRATFTGPVEGVAPAPGAGGVAILGASDPVVPSTQRPTAILDHLGNLVRAIETNTEELKASSGGGGGGGGGMQRAMREGAALAVMGMVSSGGGGHGTPGPSRGDLILAGWRNAPRTGPATGGSGIGAITTGLTTVATEVRGLRDDLRRQSLTGQTMLRNSGGL